MPRHDGSGGYHCTTKQKGKSRSGHQLSSYAVKGKGKRADRYDRPYLDGSYLNWSSQITTREE